MHTREYENLKRRDHLAVLGIEGNIKMDLKRDVRA
jgi:hypothetical protein